MIYSVNSNIKTMPSAFCHCFFALLLALFALPVVAIELEGLYQASVVIESRDDDADHQQAFARAMREVIVKVSGRTDAVNVSSIRREINNPEDYVESWVYRTRFELDPNNNTEESTTEILELEVSFYDTEIQRLLDDSNIPLWPARREETLVWVVLQEELGRREVLGSAGSIDNDVQVLLEQMAEKRGLPILLPLMDIEDQFAVSANAAWNLDADVLLAASARYQTQSVLVLRLYRSLSGELLAKSVYLFRGQALPYQSFEDDLEGFIGSSLSLVSEELSAYYAVLLSASNTAGTVNFSVEGVTTAKAYADLLNYVEELAVVGTYQINSINQQQMVMTLATGGQLRQLVETIALDDKLELIDDLRRNDDGVFLYYRWVGQ